jgi:hypothetical protein
MLALALVVALLVWSIVEAAHEPSQLRLSEAAGVTVELPDGDTVEGLAGLALPDGAVVRTGETGFAQAGETTLGPDQQATVDDGALVAEP